MKTKNYFLLIITGMIAIFLTSCSSVSVTADYDKSVDFTKFKTFEYYGWAEESDKLLNDLDKKRIEDAFGNEFYKRGFSFVESDGDLIVTLFIVVEQKTQQTAHTTHSGGGYYGGYYGHGPGYGWGPSYSTTTVSSYDYAVGTLVCDVYDKASEALIWEGIASKTIDSNPNTRDKKIPKVIEMLMAKYPVPPLEEVK